MYMYGTCTVHVRYIHLRIDVAAMGYHQRQQVAPIGSCSNQERNLLAGSTGKWLRLKKKKWRVIGVTLQQPTPSVYAHGH